MSDLSYPVFRLGFILKPEDERALSGADTVSVARQLFDNSKNLTVRFADDLKTHLGAELLKHNSPDDDGEPRIRFSPTNIVSFPNARFRWRETEFESRATIAVCTTPSRTKLWTRLNVVKGKIFNDCVQQKAAFEEIAPKLNDVWLTYFNDSCAQVPSRASYNAGFKISVFMISTDGARTDLKKIVAGQASLDFETRPTETQALQAIKDEFMLVGDIVLPSLKQPDAYSRVLSYRFARNEVLVDDRKNGRMIQQMADEGYAAVCILNVEKTGASVFGVGLDPVPPKNFRRSAAHVASAEISYDLGSMF